MSRLRAKVVVPHHYYIWDVTTRGSTLLPPNDWVDAQPKRRWVDGAVIRFRPGDVRSLAGHALCFGENVAFNKTALRRAGIGAQSAVPC